VGYSAYVSSDSGIGVMAIGPHVNERGRERETDGADGNGNVVPCPVHTSETGKGREGTAAGGGDHRVIRTGEGEAWISRVGHVDGVDPRWWHVIGARCSRGHATADGGVAIGNSARGSGGGQPERLRRRRAVNSALEALSKITNYVYMCASE